MYPRTNYEMTEADLKKILDACAPVPMIMLHIGGGRSQQERANEAWAELGGRMGFDYMTVQPSEKGQGFFTAVPNETETAKAERIAREKEEALRLKIKTLEDEITDKQTELAALLQPRTESMPKVRG